MLKILPTKITAQAYADKGVVKHEPLDLFRISFMRQRQMFTQMLIGIVNKIIYIKPTSYCRRKPERQYRM